MVSLDLFLRQYYCAPIHWQEDNHPLLPLLDLREIVVIF